MQHLKINTCTPIKFKIPYLILWGYKSKLYGNNTEILQVSRDILEVELFLLFTSNKASLVKGPFLFCLFDY